MDNGILVRRACKRIHQACDAEATLKWTPLWEPTLLEEGESRVLRVWNHADAFFQTKEPPSAKAVRGFLWELRKHRKVVRRDAVLWTTFDPQRRVYYTGLGVAVPTRVLPRLHLTSLVDPET